MATTSRGSILARPDHSDLDFDGDWEAAADAEGLLRDFEDGRGLLALVFAAFDEGEDATDKGEVDGWCRSP